MNKKKLKKKLRMTEARLYRLEQHMSELEQHTYDAVSDDIERLHQHVDMWGEIPLKDRVETLELFTMALTLDDEIARNALTNALDDSSPFEQLLQDLPLEEQERIRDIQREATAYAPAWVLSKSSAGGFELTKYVSVPELGLAESETVFTLDNKDQLLDMLAYINDALDVTGWREEDDE